MNIHELLDFGQGTFRQIFGTGLYPDLDEESIFHFSVSGLLHC